MNERKDDREREQPKGLFYFEQIDILLIVAIIAVVGTIIIMIASAIPHDGYWPKNFAEIIDIVYTLALITGGAMTLTFAAARLNDGVRESRRKDREDALQRFREAANVLGGGNTELSLFSAMEISEISQTYRGSYLSQGVRLISRSASEQFEEFHSLDASLESGEDENEDEVEVEENEHLRPQIADRVIALIRISIDLASRYEKEFDEPAAVTFWNLPFQRVTLSDVTIVPLRYARCRFVSTIFVNCKFRGEYTTQTEFRRAVFIGCNFEHSTFEGADFSKATFYGCSFSGIDFQNCNLRKAKFYSSSFVNSSED